MDFGLSEEQLLLQQNVRKFLAAEIAPVAAEFDKKGPLSREDAIYFIKKLMPFGYYNGRASAEYGGSNLDFKTFGVLHEELSRVWAGLAGLVWIAGGLGAPDNIGEEERKEFRDRMLAGESIGAGAISEPDFGSNSSNIQTTAIADGDEWVINGTKQWISNGPICDHINVTVTSDPKQPNEGRSRLANIFVDRERSPFATTRVNDILGLRAWANGELHFDDCRVPRDHMRDRPAPESGRSQRNWAFEYPRSMLAIMSTGIAQASIDASIKYAQERQQWGRPIGSFQLVQELIVDSIIETEAARFLAYRAMDLLDKGEDCSWQASVAKAYATEMGIRATSRAIEVHGGVGLLGDLPLERYFRDARTMTIPDGTTEIQKLVIGRQLIGLAAFV